MARLSEIELQFIDVAPTPVLAWLDGSHNRMRGLVKVLGSMLVL